MVRPYSEDLRKRVAARVVAGESVRSVAATFAVSVASAVRWSQLWRAKDGDVRPGKMGGHRKRILEPHRAWVMERIAREPEVTLRELAAELTGLGTPVGYSAMRNFVHREGLSFKTTLLPSEQDRPDVARHRLRWKKYQGRLDPKRLVFIDETWAKTNMAPLRGWGARGERLRAKAPYGHWKTMTFLAALRHDRIDAPFVFDGPINGEAFRLYVETQLIPTLGKGDIVVLDNLGSHKGKAVRKAIRAIGARLLFLPPYSPDLNPIEQVFSKLKHLMRRAAERDPIATWKRAGALLDRFAPDECARYLVNSGYAPS